MTAPNAHLVEAQKLTSDALVDLFEVFLVGAPNGTYVRFTNGKTVTWQSKTYEALGCKFSTVSRTAEPERSRPTLTVINPLGIFNSYAFKGYFEQATVIRKRVLLQHITSNTALSDDTYFYISKVKEMIADQSISFELRALSDGPDLMIPARVFIPPAFPFVTL